MAEYILTKKSNLVAVADSVRERTGGTDKITLGEMINDINYVIGGDGIDTSDATASENEILLGETAYVDGEKITGTFTIEEELTAQDDLIAQIQAAIITKTSVPPSLQNKTVTPNASAQIVVADSEYDGLDTVTVNGDANLAAENIAEGVSIFGVTGTHSGSGGGGAAIETVNVTFINDSRFDDYYACGTWVDVGVVDSYVTDIFCDDSKTKIAVKNSYITLDYSNVASVSGSYNNLGSIGSATAIQLKGDCTITFY